MRFVVFGSGWHEQMAGNAVSGRQLGEPGAFPAANLGAVLTSVLKRTARRDIQRDQKPHKGTFPAAGFANQPQGLSPIHF